MGKPLISVTYQCNSFVICCPASRRCTDCIEMIEKHTQHSKTTFTAAENRHPKPGCWLSLMKQCTTTITFAYIFEKSLRNNARKRGVIGKLVKNRDVLTNTRAAASSFRPKPTFRQGCLMSAGKHLETNNRNNFKQNTCANHQVLSKQTILFPHDRERGETNTD